MDVYEESLELHEKYRGKLAVRSLVRVDSQEALSLAYTPGVARPCEVIGRDPASAWNLTMKGRTIAVVSDGSAILGLGDLGPEAALPVMEGKAVLFKEFAGVDAVPIVLDVREPDAVVAAVRAIAPTFGGINLEDISAPRCFEIEDRLQDLGIPVLHDDQHGTAIVCVAAVRNALRHLGRELRDVRVVISGAGAAGRAIARVLACADGGDEAAGSIRVVDSVGVVAPGRERQDPVKEELARLTNPEGERGSLRDALRGADVFVGVSRGKLLTRADVATMREHPVVLAMANPEPEIMPDEALAGGAAVVGTGRSDFPNQVNNVLAFPGLFRGALEVGATRFTPGMKRAAIDALVACVLEPAPRRILPSPFDRSVASNVARAVADAARRDGVARITSGS
ncbi:MAG: NADP-dependent malic enzyme [Planctomycetota bacterium]